MWDGKGWTSLTKYPAAEDADSGSVPFAPLPPGPVPSRPRPAPRAPAPSPAEPTGVEPADAPARTVLATNAYSVLTLGVALVCILVASSTGLGLVALLPALAAAWAGHAREPMAPFAGLAAAAGVVIALVLLTR